MSNWTDNINRLPWHWKGTLVSADNLTTINLTDDDFLENSIKIEEACSDTEKFALGGVITSCFSCTLVDIDQKFGGFDFTNAKLTIQVGLVYEDETEEWHTRGVYYCEKPSIVSDMINLTAYDAMDKLNKYWDGGNIMTNTCDAVVMYICNLCGVNYDNDTVWQLPERAWVNHSFAETTTYRQMLSWIVEYSHGYAVIENDYLVCKFLDHSIANQYNRGKLDGGQMWFGAETANGGTIDPWSTSEYSYDGNYGIDAVEPIIFNSQISSEQITFGGIIIYPTTEGESEYQVGSDIYPLIIKDNPLIPTNAVAHTIAEKLYDSEIVSHPSQHSVVGFFRLSFRPFEATVWIDPMIRCGEWVQISDVNGNLYYAPITQITIQGGGEVELACHAQTYAENKAEYAEGKYSIVQDAVTQANGYTDSAVSTAVTNANSYTDTAVSNKSSWFSTETFSVTTASIASLGNISNAELSITATSGKTPIGIVGWDVSARAVVLAECHLKNISGNTAKIEYSLYNAYSSARTPTIVFYVLCITG